VILIFCARGRAAAVALGEGRSHEPGDEISFGVFQVMWLSDLALALMPSRTARALTSRLHVITSIAFLIDQE